jgi:hypothetical protein
MNLWTEAFDALSKVERDEPNFTVDQRLKVAEIKALLAIGQDLNGLRLKDEESFS